MKTFIGIMMLIMLATLLAWHNYTNPDLATYLKKRSIFFIVISIEFFLMVLVWVLQL